MRRINITLVLVIGLVFQVSIAEDVLEVPGLYRLETRTLLPHLEEMRRKSVVETKCLDEPHVESLFPILLQPGLKECNLLLLDTAVGEFVYKLQCGALNGAEGLAKISRQANLGGGDIIDAELNAKLGGKNMTFSQFTKAQWIGACD